MDGYELNKIIGAILGTLLFVMGIGFVAEAIYHPINAGVPGYTLPLPEGGDTGGGAAPAPVETPLPVLLASASADKGASVAKKCQSCHDFTSGGPNKTGPNLYGVVGREIAAHEGYTYSDALKGLQAADGVWTYAELNDFLTSPKAYAPGTKMTFAGLKSDKDRADILAYLQSLSDSPVPFPAPDAAPAADAAPMADAAPATDAASH